MESFIWKVNRADLLIHEHLPLLIPLNIHQSAIGKWVH